LIATVARGITRKLDTSVGVSGPHDFAVRKSAARLALLLRPPRPAPNVRDDREAPLFIEAGRPDSVPVICPTAQAKYFSQEGWTQIRKICPSGKSDAPAGSLRGKSKPVSRLIFQAWQVANRMHINASKPMLVSRQAPALM
jgi:hypothetical protein